MMHMNPLAQAALAEPAPAAPRTVDLAILAGILRRSWKLIAAAALAGLALAIAYLSVTTPVYVAQTSVFIDPRARKIVSEEIVQGGLGADAFLVESQVAIIGSDGVLRRVVENLKLAEDPAFAGAPRTGMMSRVKALLLGPTPAADPVSKAVDSLARALKVKRAAKSYVVDVEVSSSSPVQAARLADAVVAAYIADQTEAKAEEARRANTMIDARLGELRKQVREAELRVDEFQKANGILKSEVGLVSEQEVTKLNGELITARALVAEAKARIDQSQAALRAGASPETLPDALKSGLIQKLREQHAQVARREAALSSQLQGRHPVLLEIRSQLAEIRGQIQSELKRISTSAQNEYQIAVIRETEVLKALERAKGEVARTNTAQIKLRELEQEALTSRELMRVFLARAKETQEQKNITSSDARMLANATVPTQPAKPIVWLVLAIGLAGGLGLGLCAALVRDLMDARVRTAVDVTRRSGLRSLGVIPSLAGRSLLARATRLVTSRLGARPNGFASAMTALASGRSGSALAYRHAVQRVLGSIRAAARPGRPAVVLMAGAHRAAGTSTSALAIAYAAALQGTRTLLVDACSVKPDLSATFARELRQDRVIQLDNRAHLASITIRDEASGLGLLPIALADLRTLRGDQRRRFAQGLLSLAASYDLVVIDAGALLDDEAAASLLACADQVVLVARSGTGEASDLIDTAAALGSARTRLCGVVLTQAT